MVNRKGFLYNSWLDWMVMHNQAFVDGNKVDHEIPTPTPVGPNGKTLELAKYGNSAGTVITAADPAAAGADGQRQREGAAAGGRGGNGQAL